MVLEEWRVKPRWVSLVVINAIELKTKAWSLQIGGKTFFQLLWVGINEKSERVDEIQMS